MRDQVVDFLGKWSKKTPLTIEQMLEGLDVSSGKYYDWRERYGKANQHNGSVPRDFWLTPSEREAILNYQALYPTEGYRRLTYMMMDADVVAVSPSSVYRVLKEGGRIVQNTSKPSRKGTGFEQPALPHEHWHVDIAYVNIHGTFYYLCAVLDGASRYIVSWDLKPAMMERDVEIALERAKELFPDARPRVISDNGPQFVAKDFKEFIRLSGMSHVRISPYYPQSNGKIERWNKSVKSECVRPNVPLSLEEGRQLIAQYVHVYNEERLHSAIGYITPKAMLEGRREAIHSERDRKLEQARQRRAEQHTKIAEQELQAQAA